MSLRVVFMGTPDFAVPTLSAIAGAGHEVVAVYTRAPGRGRARARAAALAGASPRREPRAAGPHPALPADGGGGRRLSRRTGRTWRWSSPTGDPAAGDPRGAAPRLPQPPRLPPPPLARRRPDPARGDGRRPRDRGRGHAHGGGPRHRAGGDGGADPDRAGRHGGRGPRPARWGSAPTSWRGRSRRWSGARSTFRPQPEDGVTYARKIANDEARIDWSEAARAVHDRVRGLSPAPGAFFGVRRTRAGQGFAHESRRGRRPAGRSPRRDGTVACGAGRRAPSPGPARRQARP